MAKLIARKGKDQILLWRLEADAQKEKAFKLAFQEEHSVDASIDGGESKATKDGVINTDGTVLDEVPFTSTMAYGDKVCDMLDEAFYEQSLLELWIVDVGQKTEGNKYKAEYRQGKLDSLKKTAPTEDTVVLEGNFKTDGVRKKGEVSLTKEQEETVQYAFRDTDVYTPVEA